MTDFYFEDRIAPAAILGATLRRIVCRVHRSVRAAAAGPRVGFEGFNKFTGFITGARPFPSIAFDKKIMVLKNMQPPQQYRYF